MSDLIQEFQMQVKKILDNININAQQCVSRLRAMDCLPPAKPLVIYLL